MNNETTSTVITLSRPVMYNGEEIRELDFEWDRLTGKDSLDIENEVNMRQKVVGNPRFSGEYLLCMAVKASCPKVDRSFFLRMALTDFNRVRSAASNFLLQSEFLWGTPEHGSDDNA